MRSASDSVAQRRVTGMAGTIIGKWGIGKRGGLCGGGGASCYIDVTSCYIFEGFSQGFDSSMRRRFKPQRRKGRGGNSREKSFVKFFGLCDLCVFAVHVFAGLQRDGPQCGPYRRIRWGRAIR